jgi:hypothetical protein
MSPFDRRRRSRAVLVGVGAYEHEGLRDHPEIRQNIFDLYKILTDRERGTFLPEHCDVLLDVTDQQKLGDKLQLAAEGAEDLLLVYYAGHGLLDPKRRELHLALSSTKPDERVLGFSALPFGRVRDAFLESSARSRVLILDCCYSGRAIYGTQSAPSDEVLAQIDVSGTYTLTSSPENEASVVVPGEPHTAFTGRLLRILRGEEGADPKPLTLNTLFSRLKTSLNADGLPRPLQCTTENADQIVLVGPRSAGDPTEGRSSLSAAKAQAETLLQAARAEAAALVAQATAQADAARRSADLIAERAERDATAIRRESESEAQALRKAAEDLVAKATSEAQSASRSARLQAAELWQQAQSEIEQRDVIKAGLQGEIDRLLAERNRLESISVEPSAAGAAEMRERARRFVVDPGALRLIDEAVDDAVEYSRAVRQQAEAHYEDLRTSAAVAATDFETKLAKRRTQSERDLAARQAKAEKNLAIVETRSEQIRLEAENMRTDAERRARQTIETAQRQSDDIIADARAKTDKIRSEAERELAALTHRRNSLNAQLHNVREMLATLTGGGAVTGQPPFGQ